MKKFSAEVVLVGVGGLNGNFVSGYSAYKGCEIKFGIGMWPVTVLANLHPNELTRDTRLAISFVIFSKKTCTKKINKREPP